MERASMKETAKRKELTMLDVQLPANVPIVKRPFKEYFKGFEKLPVVKEIFGQETDRVLAELEVEFFSSRFGYMGVSDEDGHLIVSAHYLRNGDAVSKYLDVIHELVHVRQFREGKSLFNETYEYHERPTELEAHEYAVKEARRLGMSDDEIFEYLKVDWLGDHEVRRLARKLGVHPSRRAQGERVR